MKALEKDRARRYESANGFAADVQRYLTGEAVQAHPPSAGYRMRKFVRRNKGRVIAASLLILALVAGLASTTWQAIRAMRAEREAAEALVVAEQKRQEADEQRMKAETQAASIAVDIDLKYCENGEVPLGLLRLAETLKTIPEPAKELRQYAALNILTWGQYIRPTHRTLDHDGYSVVSLLSPDGLTVLTSGMDGTARLWDSITGRQRAVLGDLGLGNPGGESRDDKFNGDGQLAMTSSSHDRVVRLWDVASGKRRAETAMHPYPVRSCQLSKNHTLLVTMIFVPTGSKSRVYCWNATNGQLIRTLDCEARNPNFAVSPDGKSVLIGFAGKVQVWFPFDSSVSKQLLENRDVVETLGREGEQVAFSPSGKSAVAISSEALRWWDTSDWHLQKLVKHAVEVDNQPRFLSEDIIFVEIPDRRGGPGTPVVFTRTAPAPIYNMNIASVSASPDGSLFAFDDEAVHDSRTGKRLMLLPGRKFLPELRQFAEDGRFAFLAENPIVDLVLEKTIKFKASGYLKNQETWISLGDGISRVRSISLLRKADASLDAQLLKKWCQVVVRGKLDEVGQFAKFDEATWEKARVELAAQLELNPGASILRSATTDRLYWLREEIKESKEPLPLHDRLVAAEPIWPNYRDRASIHDGLGHWELAIRDELEAARLTGERYWLCGNSLTDWTVGAQLARIPGRPVEQYELALQWAEARRMAGVVDLSNMSNLCPSHNPSSYIVGLAQYRLGRYRDALATLAKRDKRLISDVAAILMSPWNELVFSEDTHPAPGPGAPGGRTPLLWRYFDPTDLAVRAMCHHQLGDPKAAEDCLRMARIMLGKEGGLPEQRALLREAEALIEGKAKP